MFTNLLVGIACALLIPVFGLFGRWAPSLDTTFGILQAMMVLGVQLNMVLILFNLIPIPPLDGSHVMKYLLPAKLSFRYMQVSRAGVAILILVMYLAPQALNVWLSPAFFATDKMIGLVQTTILQSTSQWLQ